MKKLFVFLASLVASAGIVAAQDMAVATDTYNNGVTTLQAGDNAGALKLFQEALVLGEACGDEGAELVTNCKNVIPGLFLSVAKGLINDAKYDEAVVNLEKAAETAKAYEVEGVADEAVSLIVNAWYRKGASLLKEKQFAEAAEALKKVVEAEPENGQAALYLGNALLSSGDTAGAIEALTAAAANGQETAANKMLSNIYLKQGQALYKEAKFAEAIEAFKKANGLVENPTVYKLLAGAYTKSGKTADAMDAYKKYLEVNPNAPDASGVILTIAATAQKAGDKKTAIEYYKKIVADPKYGETAKQQLEVLQK